MHYLTNTLIIILTAGLLWNYYYWNYDLDGKLQTLKLLSEGKEAETRPMVYIVLACSILYSSYYYLGY